MVAGLCHFVFSSFRGEKSPSENTRRNGAMRKGEKTKNAMQKDEITPCNKMKL